MYLTYFCIVSLQETSHHVYLVMEYCDGGDLADFLQGTEHILPKGTFFFVLNICSTS